MQIDRKSVAAAKKGDEVGILMPEDVHTGYRVYKAQYNMGMRARKHEEILDAELLLGKLDMTYDWKLAEAEAMQDNRAPFNYDSWGRLYCLSLKRQDLYF